MSFFLLADRGAKNSKGEGLPSQSIVSLPTGMHGLPRLHDQGAAAQISSSFVPWGSSYGGTPQSLGIEFSETPSSTTLDYGLEFIDDLDFDNVATIDSSALDVHSVSKSGLRGAALSDLDIDNPVTDPAQSSAQHPKKQCDCIVCLMTRQLGGSLTQYAHYFRETGYTCIIPGCSLRFGWYLFDCAQHVKGHFRLNQQFVCKEEHCGFVTKRWADLQRHYTAKHCTNPQKATFPCPIPWCKYSGNNGFARKDKFKSHYNNVHKGNNAPGKANRVMKPAGRTPDSCASGNLAAKEQN